MSDYPTWTFEFDFIPTLNVDRCSYIIAPSERCPVLIEHGHLFCKHHKSQVLGVLNAVNDELIAALRKEKS